jgi:hypothetical protein
MSTESSLSGPYSDPLQNYSVVPASDLAEMAAHQGFGPVENLDSLVGDFWPEDETVDEFLDYLRAKRREEA